LKGIKIATLESNWGTDMKIAMLIFFTIFAPLVASAAVDCPFIQDYDCNVAHANCITVEAVLGQSPPAEESTPESID
jgi:hypothetical protein